MADLRNSLLPAPPVPSDTPRAKLLRQIEADLAGSPLDPWQTSLCKWLALHPGTSLNRQREVASALAGTTVSGTELRQLKYRAGWRRLWVQLRTFDRELDKARETFAELLPTAADVYKRAVTALDTELASGDAMAAVRAAPPLLTPVLDRVWPKKQEGAVSATITITLTPAQALGLTMDETVVEAEEVEVIPASAEEPAP